ncbi:MAG: hypothetical protein IPL61_07865 [Myxococcales bacterium]|nr:hypothetical protein [Myxococcales bacterium]
MTRALGALVVAACATPAAPVTNPTAPPPGATLVAAPAAPVARPPIAPTAITIAYLPARDAWSVEWQLGAPAAALRFDRLAAAAPRGALWRAPDALAWRQDGDADVLVAVDGVARTRFTAEFGTDDQSPGRAPPQNLRWTDGSRLVFTGAVGADAEVCVDDRCGPRAGPRAWRLVAADRQLRVGDAVAADELAWTEPVGDRRGTYAYVGGAAAATVDEATVALVVDRGLPRWLAAETARLVPAALADLGARTGVAPTARPLVLVSLRPAGGAGYAVRGRALPDLVQLEAGGRGWRTRTTAGARLWRELVVHELFHLWNGQLARRADRKDEWLSEGASSFVAGLALRDAGLLDARQWGRRVVAVGNRCARALVGPLYGDAAEPAYYDCGELVQAALDRALTGTGGLWPIYRRLFADARARPSGAYATADFLALCEAAGADPGTLGRVRALIELGLGADPQATARALLADAGLATTVVPARRGRPARLRWVAAPAPRRARGSVRP